LREEKGATSFSSGAQTFYLEEIRVFKAGAKNLAVEYVSMG
jgi:hypothetical protein